MTRFKTLFMLLTLVYNVMWGNAATSQSVIVRTKYGDIRGTKTIAPLVHGSAVTRVNQFTGIPFAAPPVGELRFKPPSPPEGWKPKVYDATQFGKVCIQDPNWLDIRMKPMFPGFGKANYSEDCLYLNVYAPAQNDSLNPTTQYPVMIYIHGGGFTSGTGLLSPGLVLPTYGVVLVTIQYRLGPFGFVFNGDSTASGNLGMLDQVMALRWVNENIRSFGGDPKKVTIFGFSAGGASVSLHLLSPLSKDFFHGAISESGVDLSPWSVVTADLALSRTTALANKIGCKDKEPNEFLECMKQKNAWDIFNSGGDLWTPIVDSFAGDKSFLPDSPQNLRAEGKFKSVPYIVGFTSNDAAYFLRYLANTTVDLAFFQKTTKEYASLGLSAERDKEDIRVLKNALEFQYTPWGQTADPTKLRQSIVDINSDRWFLASSVQACKVHNALAPAYMFVFNYRSKFALTPDWMGATHGDNFIFDFGAPVLNTSRLPLYDATDRNVSHLVMTMYTNFAKLGNPTPEPLMNGVQWTAFNSTNLAYLHIDVSPEMRSNYQPHRMAFWNEYHPKLMKSAHACKPSVQSAAGKVLPYISCMFLSIFGIVSITFV